MKPKKYPKWLLVVTIVAAIVGGGGFEAFYRLKVSRSEELTLANQWVGNSEFIRSRIGSVRGVELRRVLTKYGIGTAGTDGRFHLYITGEKGGLDVLITWYRRPNDSSITVTKIESASLVRELLWADPKRSKPE